jgi:hypothetical protein
VVTLGMSSADLGIILSINPIGALDCTTDAIALLLFVPPYRFEYGSVMAPAMRMFGYAKREIVGRNVSAVVPEPMAGAHDMYMRNYISSGTDVRAAVDCAGLAMP